MRIRHFCYLFISIVVLFVSCGRETGVQTLPPRQNPLLILLGSDVSTFDPEIPFEVESSYVLGNIFETLVEFDTNFRLSPRLAVRWTNPDDRTWRFYLNDRARFSDGTPLKASDVRFSIERLKSLSYSDLQGFTQHISAVRVVDDHMVDIQTETPISILNDLVFIPIMNENQVRSVGDKIGETPFGTGPYKLVKWEKKKRIVLATNQYFEPRPEVTEVNFVISEDSEKVLDDVLTMKPDIAMYIPFRKIEEFQKRKTSDLDLVSSSGITVEYLAFNLRPSIPDFKGKNPLTDLKFRQALSHAIDSSEIVGTILKGFGRPSPQLVSPEIFGFDPAVTAPAYDMEAAKKLVTEGKYTDTVVPIYTIEGGSYRLENLLASQWEKIGVKSTLKLWKDTNEMYQALNTGNFAVTIQGYACTSGDASELLTFNLHTRDDKRGYGKGNYAAYSDSEVDKICEENLHFINPKVRLEKLQRSMRIVAEDLPYLPLVISPDVYIVSNRIRWTPAVTGELQLRTISFQPSR